MSADDYLAAIDAYVAEFRSDVAFDRHLRQLADLALVCEEHPSLPWPHEDCAGPGMLREDVGS